MYCVFVRVCACSHYSLMNEWMNHLSHHHHHWRVLLLSLIKFSFWLKLNFGAKHKISRLCRRINQCAESLHVFTNRNLWWCYWLVEFFLMVCSQREATAHWFKFSFIEIFRYWISQNVNLLKMSWWFLVIISSKSETTLDMWIVMKELVTHGKALMLSVFLGVCPWSSCLLTNVLQTLHEQWESQTTLMTALLFHTSNAVHDLDLYCLVLFSPSVCSSSSSPVLGCSPTEGVFGSCGGWSTSLQQSCRASICCI